MDDHLPEFGAPPVIETAIGVQFQPLPNYTTAHAGWFWREHLNPAAWPKVTEVERLEDQFERFGDERKWGLPGLRLRLGTSPDRTQFAPDDETRLVQIQNSRLIYNWRKRTGDYPRYSKLRSEFDSRFVEFSQFARDANLGELSLNQWEITYVNHIPKGDLWHAPEDWPKILPNLSIPVSRLPGVSLDSLDTEWSLNLHGNLGRLHISLKHGRAGSPTGPEVLILQLTARGPMANTADLNTGLNLAHEFIVRSFTEMTSETAHKFWKRRS